MMVVYRVKRLFINKRIRPYLITYLIVLCISIPFAAGVTVNGESGSLPVIIITALVGAFLLSIPVWGVQTVFFVTRRLMRKQKGKVAPVEACEACKEKEQEDAPYRDSLTAENLAMKVSDRKEQKEAELAAMAEKQRKEQDAARHRALALSQETIERNRLRAQALETEQKAKEEKAISLRKAETAAFSGNELLCDAIQFTASHIRITRTSLAKYYPNLDSREIEALLQRLIQCGAAQTSADAETYLCLLEPEAAQRLIERLQEPAHAESTALPQMDGHTFEHYCAGLLSKNGFVNVEVTQASGDYGIDVLAEKDDITYAIQCKYYSDKVGNHAVQEAFSGKEYYDRMVAAVMTNSTFTAAAVETAKETHVLLWDGSMLAKMAENK